LKKKIAFLCIRILTTDRRTDKQTNRWAELMLTVASSALVSIAYHSSPVYVRGALKRCSCCCWTWYTDI